MNSVYLYPSLCYTEGTVLSCGRGTEFPFQVLGAPKMPDTGFSNTLREQIMQGMTVEEIRATWKEEMDQFRKTRAKYLLYN